MWSRCRQAACIITIAILLNGCTDQPRPEYAKVEGTVRINGKPEHGLSVRFSPDPEKGNALPAIATGITNGQGKYTLQYEYRGEEGEGAPVGWHRVTIVDTKVGFTPQGQQPKPSAVPYEYGNPSTTPLVIEVKPGESQTIDLDVKR